MNHKVTFSPFYKPHPFLSEGMDARKINSWTFFPEIYCIIDRLLNLLNIRNIWQTTEPHQENLFSYSKLCQTEAPSVQFPQRLYMNFSWELFEVCLLSGYDHLDKPIARIPVCVCMQVHTYRFGLYLREKSALFLFRLFLQICLNASPGITLLYWLKEFQS